MATRIIRCSWLCCLLAAAALAALPGLGVAEPEVIEAAVRVPPAKQPALYLRFRNNKLWMAATQAGLEKATPLRAAGINLNKPENADFESRDYAFPEISLPQSLTGVENTRVTFHTYHTISKSTDAPGKAPEDRTDVAATFTLSNRDSSRAIWTYILNSYASSDTAKLPAQRLELILPKLDPDKLKLEVEVKVEERNARIGLRVKSGDRNIDTIMKGDVKARVTVEIINKEGQTVVSEKGDLQKFGFT